MDTETKSQVHQALLSRRHAIADDWHKVIAQTSGAEIPVDLLVEAAE